LGVHHKSFKLPVTSSTKWLGPVAKQECKQNFNIYSLTPLINNIQEKEPTKHQSKGGKVKETQIHCILQMHRAKSHESNYPRWPSQSLNLQKKRTKVTSYEK